MPSMITLVFRLKTTVSQYRKVFLLVLEKDRKLQKEDGLGLGLTIVTSLVENFGGNITFNRSLTGGLKVTVNLPAVKRNNS